MPLKMQWSGAIAKRRRVGILAFFGRLLSSFVLKGLKAPFQIFLSPQNCSKWPQNIIFSHFGQFEVVSKISEIAVNPSGTEIFLKKRFFLQFFFLQVLKFKLASKLVASEL